MRFFHRHQWKLVGRTHQPPALGQIEEIEVGTEMLARLAFGFTRLELRCEDCGDFKFVVGPGTR